MNTKCWWDGVEVCRNGVCIGRENYLLYRFVSVVCPFDPWPAYFSYSPCLTLRLFTALHFVLCVFMNLCLPTDFIIGHLSVRLSICLSVSPTSMSVLTEYECA